MFSMQDPHVTDKIPCGCVQLACQWRVGARKSDLLYLLINLFAQISEEKQTLPFFLLYLTLINIV